MSGTTSRTKAAALARVQALVAGTLKHFPSGSFTLGNVAYTTATLVPVLQGLADAITAANTAKAGAKDAAAALKAVEAKVDPVIRDYKRFVLAAFSNTTQDLADFGMAPPKARKPKTSEQNAAAAAKAKATRAKRGTVGPKKRLTITGDVTGVDITPITAPEAPAPAAQTVSNASSAPTGAPK